MVEEEHWIYARANTSFKSATRTQQTMKPFHTVRRPLLSRVAAIGWTQSIWTQPRHITSKNDMRSRMRSREVLEISLEVIVIPIERGKRVINICLREREVDRRGEIDGWCTGESSGIKDVCEIAADVVFDGVGKRYVLETTSVDLKIVRRVTPTSETLIRVVREDRGIEKVGSVWLRVRAAVPCHS